MINRIAFFIFCVFNIALSTCLFSQQSKQIWYLTEMNKKFAMQNSVKAEYDIKIYDGSKVLFDYVQTSIRHNDMMWIDALNTNILINKEFFIKADHSNKLLVIEKSKKILPSNNDILSMPFDSTFKDIKSFTKISDLGNNKIQFSFFTGSNFEKVAIVMDSQSFLPEKISYFLYDQSFSKVLMRMEVVVKSIVFSFHVDNDLFSENQFFKKKGKSFVVMEKYKDYNLLIIRP